MLEILKYGVLRNINSFTFTFSESLLISDFRKFDQFFVINSFLMQKWAFSKQYVKVLTSVYLEDLHNINWSYWILQIIDLNWNSKHAPGNVIDNLLDIFNLLWKINSFPEFWRILLLKPNKNPVLLYSYRPIFLTSVLCKILERIINKRIMWKLVTHV